MHTTGHRFGVGLIVVAVVSALFQIVPEVVLPSPAGAVTIPSAVTEFQPTLADRWGGRTISVDISPANTDVVIAASESGGLFRSTDGGANWSHLDGLIPHRMNDVKYAPNNASVVMATTWATGDTQNPGGIWRSTNGGTSWQRPASLAAICTGNFNAWGVSFEPSSSNVYAGTDCGVAFSNDQGATWSLQNAPQVHAVVAATGGVVHVCATDGYSRYTLTGGTLTLAAGPVQFPAIGPGDTASGCPNRQLASALHNLAVSPLEPAVLFASTDGRSSTLCGGTVASPATVRFLLESDDTGATWNQIGGGCTARLPWVSTHLSRDGDPTHFDMYYSGGLDLYRVTCVQGTAGNTTTRRCTGLPAIGSPNVTDAHADLQGFSFGTAADNCARFLASDGGLQTTTDCGATFTMAAGSGTNGGYNALQLYEVNGQVHPGGHTDLYMGTQDNDVWGSTDGGATWPNKVCCEGWTFQTPYQAPTDAGQTVTFVTCGPCNNRSAGAHLSGPGAWSNAGTVTGVDTGAPYLLQGTSTNYLQWSGGATVQLNRTANSGTNWTAITGATTTQQIVGRAAVVGPSSDPTVYQAFCTPATCGNFAPSAGLLRLTGLTAGTATVTTIGGGLATLGTYNMGNAGFLTQEPTLGVDRNNPLHLIAADIGSNTMKQSVDGGATWTTDNQLTSLVTRGGTLAFGGIYGAGTEARAIAFDPADSNRILVGTESNGIIASIDGGQSWFKMVGSERVTAISSFFFDSVNGDIFVSSFGRGLWKVDFLNADLAVTKSHHPDPAVAGEQLFYDITVTNNGPDASPGAIVTDTLPAQVKYVTSTLSSGGGDACTANSPPPGTGQTVTCQIGALDSGSSVSFSIKVFVSPDTVSNAGSPTQITNTVTVQGIAALDPDASNNVDTDTVIVEDRADLLVTKLCKPDTVVLAGTPINCTIFVDNAGPSYARNVVVDDAILSNGSFLVTNITPALGPGTPGCTLTNITGGQNLTCRIGNLANASTSSSGRATITYTITATEGQDINNVARARSDTPDPNPNNNFATVSLTVTAVADLSISKSGPASAVAGTDITYNLSVTNNGPSTAANVVITDAVPAGVTILSVSSSVGTCNVGVPGDPLLLTTCAIGTLAPSASATMTVNVHIKPDTLGVIHNDARVSSDTFDTNLSNNLATFNTNVTASADLSITKSGSPNPVLAGQQLTYTMTATNSGPSTALSVKITDTLPAGTSFVSGVDGNGTTVCALLQANTVVCDLGTMSPNTSKTVYLTVLVAASVPNGTHLVNSATVSSATPDPNQANNTATSDTTVNAQAELWLDKTGVLRSGNPAPVLVYTLYVHNNAGCETDAQSTVTPNCGAGGPSDAQNITVTDKLPLDPKKLVVQFLSPQCTYTKATHSVVCTAPTLPAGATAQFVIEAQVQGSVGTITNTATVTSTTADPVTANNTNAVAVVIKGGTGKNK